MDCLRILTEQHQDAKNRNCEQGSHEVSIFFTWLDILVIIALFSRNILRQFNSIHIKLSKLCHNTDKIYSVQTIT